MTNAEPSAESQHTQQATLTDVSAGGNVIVELHQVLIACSADPTSRAAAETLLRGPLAEVGAEADARRASELAEAGAHAEAGELFLGVSAALAPRFKIVAEFFDHEAIAQFRVAGAHARAAEIAVGLAEAQIARCDAGAVSAARTAREFLGDDDVLGPALLAVASGVETGASGTEALAAVTAHYRGGAEEITWAARLVERLLLDGRIDEALTRAGDVRKRIPLADGPRLMVELDYLDALIAGRRVEDADGVIAILTGIAAEPRRDTKERGLIWQRLGVAEYTLARYSGAERAFFSAIEQWGRATGAEDQIAECFFAAEECRLRRGEIHQEGFMLRPLAAALRGSNTHAASLGETLETRGLRYRIRNKLPDARDAYWQGYAVHRRAGDLIGTRGCAAALAEVYEEAGHAAEAARFYALAGDEKNTGRIAQAVTDAAALVASLPLTGSAHQRAASYVALASVGRRLDDDVAAQLAKTLSAEAAGQASIFGPSPPRRALQALAELICNLDGDLLAGALDLLRPAARSGDADLARSASRALIVATNADLADDSALLLEIALSDTGDLARLPTNWLASRLESRPELRPIVTERARAGSRRALEVAAIADLVDGDELLAMRCEELVAGSVGQVNYETAETDAGRVTSATFGVLYEDLGIFARFATPATRGAFFDSVLAVVLDGNDALVNRTSACNAIFNMAPNLTAQQAGRAYQGLLPLALGEVSLSHVDLISQGTTDPLSRYKASLGVPEWLRSAAVTCLGRLDATHATVDATAPIEALLAEEPTPDVLAAAFEGHAHLSVPLPPQLARRGQQHSAGHVRAATLQAWGARRGDLDDDDVVGRALGDPAVEVRLQLAIIARHMGDTEVLERLQGDYDALVRAYAMSHLRTISARG